MLGKLFRSKKEEELRSEKEVLEIEIERLRNDLKKKEAFIKCKNSFISENDNKKKQEQRWETMERELKKYHKENSELKKILEEGERILQLDYARSYYKLPVEKYFFEIRYKGMVESLKEKGIIYIQDLDLKIIETLDIDEKLRLSLKEKYQKFRKLEINWNMKTHLLKGEKISKLYYKNRKFLNIVLSENREFMCDLEKYKFQELINKGFTNKEVKELIDIYEEYMIENRIKRIE